MSSPSLKEYLYEDTFVFGLRLWVVIGIVVGASMLVILSVLVICVTIRNHRRLRRATSYLPINQIPAVSKEIKEVRVDQPSTNNFAANNGNNGILPTNRDNFREKESDKLMVQLELAESKQGDDNSDSSSFRHADKEPSFRITDPSPFIGLPEFSQLGWGHWFTLRDLELATNQFSKDNVLGEGGYGVVYRGQLINGTQVAVKKLLNNL